MMHCVSAPSPYERHCPHQDEGMETGHSGFIGGLSLLRRPLGTAMLVLSLALFGCAGGGQDRGEEVTMRACRVCHGADRLCAGLGRLDEKGWDEVVGRMVTHGASLTAEERNLAVGWLVSRKPGDKPPCP